MTYLVIGLIFLTIASFMIGILWGIDEIDGEEAAYFFLIALVASLAWIVTLALAVLVSPIFLGKWYASRKR